MSMNVWKVHISAVNAQVAATQTDPIHVSVKRGFQEMALFAKVRMVEQV